MITMTGDESTGLSDQEALPWLTPSRAFVLQECPERWLSESTTSHMSRSGAATSPEAALGVTLHKALELWIKGEDWTNCGSFGRRIHEAESALGIALGDAARTKVTKSSLSRVVERDLAQWLAGLGTEARVDAEVPLVNEALRIHGVADLVVREDRFLCIIDLKTGRPRSGTERLQLELYVALLLPSSGRLMGGILRPLQGLSLREIPTEDCYDSLERLLALRDSAIRGEAPRPGPICAGCPVRSLCPAQWSAVEECLVSDAVRGEVVRVERSREVAAVQIRKASGRTAVVTGLPQQAYDVGSQYAFMEIEQRTPSEYRARHRTRVSMLD